MPYNPDIFSLKEVRIEPSIREGRFLNTAIYGPTAIPIVRFPPNNLSLPFIVGDRTLPGVLTCFPGTWSASPTAKYAYQWMLDGIDIPGEVNQTLNTIIPYDGQVPTCEVRAYNTQGEDYAVTPVGLPLSIIDPIESYDQDLHVISGLTQNQEQVVHQRFTKIITGIAGLNTFTTLRAVAYFTTGLSGDLRTDINGMSMYAVQGRERANTMEVYEASRVAVVTEYAGFPLVTGEPQPLPLKNNAAEIGTAGWEVFGRISTRSTDVSYDGDLAWNGGEFIDAANANIPYSTFHQDVPVWPVWETGIDTGNTFLELNWRAYVTNNADDQTNVRVEFFDTNMTSLGAVDPFGFWTPPTNWWWLHEFYNIPIPANTRYIRILGELLNISGRDSEAFIDSIGARIRLGDRVVTRDFGPDFERWRLRFTESPVYSGVALSEIEFRSSIGGADLATGGTPLFGSTGNGGIAAQAFDDLRNLGYWAGEINGVTNGTSWIGYNMGNPVKPAEIDITARSGSNALQMGTAFMLEGSDANGSWIPVQYFKDIPTFSSNQQRQFVVLDGPQPMKWNGTENTDLRSGVAVDRNAFVKGLGFESTVRHNITHVGGYFSQTGPFRIHIARLTVNGNRESITGPIFSQDVNVAATAQWVEFALSGFTETFEVFDLFMIAFEDLQDPPSADNKCPIYYHHDNNNGAVDLVNWPMAQVWLSFDTNDTNLREGMEFNFGFNYAIDFRGEVF